MNRDDLVRAATAVRGHAYAPYSGFRVGAALALEDGRLFTGVNVENAAYGLTVCAERHALAAAVCAGAKPGDVQAIAIVAETPGVLSPCGACRQVLAELGAHDMPVHLHNLRRGDLHTFTVAELLPAAFGPRSLQKPQQT